MIELKIRRKGKLIEVPFYEDCLPSCIKMPDGLKGVDMTRMSVIYCHFGRCGDEKARNVFKRTGQRVPVVYTFDCRTGFGHGMFLPTKTFQKEKLIFYKTEDQKKKENKKIQQEKAKEMCGEIESMFPDQVRASFSCFWPETIKISPILRVFMLDGWWPIRTRKLTLEVEKEIQKRLPIWQAYEGLVIDLLKEKDFSIPKKWIEIYFSSNKKTLRICCDDETYIIVEFKRGTFEPLENWEEMTISKNWNFLEGKLDGRYILN